MATRLETHAALCGIDSSLHVYYDPPETVKLVYPCIIYNPNSHKYTRADDAVYRRIPCYDILIITKDYESSLPEKFEKTFRYWSAGDPYTADNLMHFPYTLHN